MGTEHLTLGGACRQGKTYLPGEGGCKSERFFAPTWWERQNPGAPVRSNGSRASPRVEGEPPRPVRSNGSRASPRTEGWLGLRKEGRTRSAAQMVREPHHEWFEGLTTSGRRAAPAQPLKWFESLTTGGSRASPRADGGPHPPSPFQWFEGLTTSGRRAAPAQSVRMVRGPHHERTESRTRPAVRMVREPHHERGNGWACGRRVGLAVGGLGWWKEGRALDEVVEVPVQQELYHGQEQDGTDDDRQGNGVPRLDSYAQHRSGGRRVFGIGGGHEQHEES